MSDFTVRGVPEVKASLHAAGAGFDEAKASQDAAEAILPEVKRRTRVQSGASQQSWRVEGMPDGAAFINEMEYAAYQEFGTEDIDPTYAVFHAWTDNEDDVLKAFAKEVKASGKDAGFHG